METQRMSVHVERDPDGTLRATISFYTLSLVGIKESTKQLAQEATYTFAFSDNEAYQEGQRQCEARWPTALGWTHLVAIKPISIPVELIEKIPG